jgi:hypothetical protein
MMVTSCLTASVDSRETDWGHALGTPAPFLHMGREANVHNEGSESLQHEPEWYTAW